MEHILICLLWVCRVITEERASWVNCWVNSEYEISLLRKTTMLSLNAVCFRGIWDFFYTLKWSQFSIWSMLTKELGLQRGRMCLSRHSWGPTKAFTVWKYLAFSSNACSYIRAFHFCLFCQVIQHCCVMFQQKMVSDFFVKKFYSKKSIFDQSKLLHSLIFPYFKPAGS